MCAHKKIWLWLNILQDQLNINMFHKIKVQQGKSYRIGMNLATIGTCLARVLWEERLRAYIPQIETKYGNRMHESTEIWQTI